MAFISADTIAKQYGNQCKKFSGPSDEFVIFGFSKGGEGRRKQINFNLGREIVKRARFLPSDRVDVLFDPTSRRGLIKRVAAGGWALSPLGKSPSALKEGELTRLSVKLTWREGMPKIAESEMCTNVAVTGIGIEFTFPKEAKFE